MLCPDDFISACSNSPFSCPKCLAGGDDLQSGHSLLFSPVKGSYLKKADHPQFKRKPKKQKNTSIQRGYKAEKAIAKELNATKTRSSGSVYHDGDFHLNDKSLVFDSKVKSTKSFTLTYSEYNIGLSAGVNAWILTNVYDTKVVVIDYETFKSLLNSKE